MKTLTPAYRFACAAVVIAAGVVTLPAHAQSAKKTLNVQTIATYPPFIYKEPGTDKLTGFDIDLDNAVAAAMGMEARYTDTSFAELTSFAALKTDRADMAGGGLSDIPQRRELVNLVDYINDPIRFYMLSSNREAFKNPDSMCGKKVALTRVSVNTIDAVKKFSDETCVKAGKPAVIDVSSDNSVQTLQMVNQGRVDAATNGGGALAYLNTLEPNKYMAWGAPLGNYVYAWAIRKDNMKLAEDVKNALNKVIADGTYDKILKKWNLSADASIRRALLNGQP